jgi:hypothetical protein
MQSVFGGLYAKLGANQAQQPGMEASADKYADFIVGRMEARGFIRPALRRSW